jgi:hypothetical protein
MTKHVVRENCPDQTPECALSKSGKCCCGCASLEKEIPIKYIVYIYGPPYPSKGFYIKAKRIPHNNKDFYDTLPASLVDSATITTSEGIGTALALGLEALYKKAKSH